MIRDAVIADVDALVALGTSFLAQTPYGALLPTQPAAIAGIMTRLIESPDGVLFVSVDRAGTLTGMLGALCFVHPLSGEWVASEFYWWVEPAARGGLDSLRLLKLTITWARAQGAVRLHMIAPEGSGVGRLYRRLGFVPVETAYQKDLTTDDDVFTRYDYRGRPNLQTTQRASGMSERPPESPEPATRGLPARSTGIVAARQEIFNGSLGCNR
jgi:GNAT superfamily N-acetyltransferase